MDRKTVHNYKEQNQRTGIKIEKGEVEGDGNFPTLIVVCLTAAACIPAGVATVTFFGEAY